MLLTIVGIWAIVIPLAVLGISWQLANLRDERAPRAVKRSDSELGPGAARAAAVPACAAGAARPRRTLTRRVCPERPRGAGRRPASA
jgi:hypothetical protein